MSEGPNGERSILNFTSLTKIASLIYEKSIKECIPPKNCVITDICVKPCAKKNPPDTQFIFLSVDTCFINGYENISIQYLWKPLVFL